MRQKKLLDTRKQRVGSSQREHLNLGRQVIYQVPVLASEQERVRGEIKEKNVKKERLKSFQIDFITF